jgi:hypothetical protein
MEWGAVHFRSLGLIQKYISFCLLLIVGSNRRNSLSGIQFQCAFDSIFFSGIGCQN